MSRQLSRICLSSNSRPGKERKLSLNQKTMLRMVLRSIVLILQALSSEKQFLLQRFLDGLAYRYNDKSHAEYKAADEWEQ